jgi:hypothetical protein
MGYRQIDKMSKKDVDAITTKASEILKRIEEL